MKPRVLIVEDDEMIIDTIEDIVFSMGHEHVWVTNQLDAQEALKSNEFDYVLLDMQIPAKPNRGGADKQFGINLVTDIRRIKGPGRLPVIMMTAYASECLDLSGELRAAGVREFVSKPFTEHQKLARVINKVLAGNPKTEDGSDDEELRPFAGGDLVFFDDHIELLGVKIDVKSGGVVCRDEGGYYLQNWIVTRDCIDVVTADVPAGVSAKPSHVPANDSAVPGHVSAPNSTDKLNERQTWVLLELHRGTQLRRAMVEHSFDVGEKTAKRDLANLSRRGLIQFVRQGRDGYYRLKSRSAKQAPLGRQKSWPHLAFSLSQTGSATD